jgi:hypothetical protein
MKRAILVLGILLVAAGLAGLIHPNFQYHRKEEVARIGPFHATVDQPETLTVPMSISILLLAAGAGLTFFGVKPAK